MTDSGSKYTRETVLEVQPWVAGKLLSIVTTRSPSYEFAPGQFARLGLPADHSPDEPPTIWRAYSMVTAPSQRDRLEFYSIVVPEGEFSPRLASLQVGNPLYVDKTAFGFLTLDRFVPSGTRPQNAPPGGDLWLLATGTGLSAYLSILQDPTVWSMFDHIVLVHGVRNVEELAYREQILQWVDKGPALEGSPKAEASVEEASKKEASQKKPSREAVQGMALPATGLWPAGLARRAQLTYLPIATRESVPGMPQARLTALLQDGRLEQLAGRPLNAETSKIMLCGNPDMLTEARAMLKERGFAVGRRGNAGNLALENYW